MEKAERRLVVAPVKHWPVPPGGVPSAQPKCGRPSISSVVRRTAKPLAGTLTLPAWTSLAHLRLMANVQQEFGLRLSMDEMMAMTSVESIEQVLSANGVEA